MLWRLHSGCWREREALRRGGGMGGGGGGGGIVVTTGIEPSSNIGNALVSAMYGRSSELGLYLWGNPPLPTVQGLPPPAGGG